MKLQITLAMLALLASGNVFAEDEIYREGTDTVKTLLPEVVFSKSAVFKKGPKGKGTDVHLGGPTVEVTSGHKFVDVGVEWKTLDVNKEDGQTTSGVGGVSAHAKAKVLDQDALKGIRLFNAAVLAEAGIASNSQVEKERGEREIPLSVILNRTSKDEKTEYGLVATAVMSPGINGEKRGHVGNEGVAGITREIGAGLAVHSGVRYAGTNKFKENELGPFFVIGGDFSTGADLSKKYAIFRPLGILNAAGAEWQIGGSLPDVLMRPKDEHGTTPVEVSSALVIPFGEHAGEAGRTKGTFHRIKRAFKGDISSDAIWPAAAEEGAE